MKQESSCIYADECQLSEVFNDIWQVALADLRQDYPKIEFPDEWQFSRDVETILSAKFWQD